MRSVWAGILLLSLVVDLYGGAFHALGHALHCILTRAKYSRFAGTHVPVDFVQAPSRMLQNWIWNKRVFDTFAADHRDRTKRIPDETVKKMNNAKPATAGMFYRRQFAFADADLALHGPHPPEDAYDCVAMSNPIFERVFLPINAQTSFITGFRGRLTQTPLQRLRMG